MKKSLVKADTMHIALVAIVAVSVVHLVLSRVPGGAQVGRWIG